MKFSLFRDVMPFCTRQLVTEVPELACGSISKGQAIQVEYGIGKSKQPLKVCTQLRTKDT
jgi:hypothetical protein